jgi:hypothetical protein
VYVTGEASLHNEDKKKQYTFVYIMGILKTIKYSEFDPELNCYLKEVEMDISFMRIAVKKIRVIKE